MNETITIQETASTPWEVEGLEDKGRVPFRIIIAGGGTGGHIFPAIAIANAIVKMQPKTAILFVGANGKMEMEKVPLAGLMGGAFIVFIYLLFL